MTDETITLPEPAGYVNRVEEGRILMLPRYSLDTAGMQAIFTADQVRAAVLQAKREERERCAMVCDKMARDYRRYCEGMGVCTEPPDAQACAAAIRSGHSITETQRAED